MKLFINNDNINTILKLRYYIKIYDSNVNNIIIN